MVEFRRKEYPLRRFYEGKGRRKRERKDRGGIGYEIAREARFCPACSGRGALTELTTLTEVLGLYTLEERS